jgi:Tfp pilus assembly protein PilO
MRTAANLKSTSRVSYRKNLADIYKKPAAQVSTALILTIFTITFFAIFAIRPTLATIVELNKRIDDQKIVVEKLEKKATALATAQSEYLLIEEKIPLIDAAIPKTYSLDTLLTQIEGIAASLNAPIDSIQVDEISFPEELVDEKKVGKVVDLPLNITISSTFMDIKEFMVMLSKIKRLVSIESISFSSETVDEGNLLKMNLSVKAYHLPNLNEEVE